VLGAFASAFRTPDLRKKLLFTLSILVLFRLGASVPTPNTNTSAINSCLHPNDQAQQNIYSLINLFSGGALLKLSVFALGIMPYITASIIIQLLVVVIPRFEALKKEGQSGTARLTQYTRYLTIGLAILQSTGLVFLFNAFGGVWSREPLNSSGLLDEARDVERVIEAASPAEREALAAAASTTVFRADWYTATSDASRWLDGTASSTSRDTAAMYGTIMIARMTPPASSEFP